MANAGTGIPLLDVDTVASSLAKNGDQLYNLTWAINGDDTHTWQTQKVVYERLKAVEENKALMEAVLADLGEILGQGNKLF